MADERIIDVSTILSKWHDLLRERWPNFPCQMFTAFMHNNSQELVRCKDCVYFRDKHVRTDDGQIKFYEEFPPEAFDALGTGSVTMEYGINVGSQCLVDCNRGYGEDKTVFREADDFCSRGYRKMNKKETEE